MAIGGSPITIVHIIVLVIRVLICTNKNKRNDMIETNDIEALKDIAWVIKGMILQSSVNETTCIFDTDHAKALRNAINYLQEKK